jgi:4-hydroxythreonine-4-phosphate dehydrogenase
MESNKSQNNQIAKPKIAITIGDINGIGPEVIIKTLSDSRILTQLTPVIFGSSKTLSYYRKTYNFNNFNFTPRNLSEPVLDNKINVFNCWEDAVDIQIGTVTPEAGTCARLALQEATNALKAGAVDGVVTAPINKSNIYSDDFQFKGHTGYFASHFSKGDNLMMMVSDTLKVGLVTDHIPIHEVASNITKEVLRNKIGIFKHALRRDFGISKPRIAVLGLNPHAGEEGLLGNEEVDIIQPVIAELKSAGNLIFGPFPADGFFGSNAYQNYDGVLGMYHDQVLIPFKSLAFHSGVNYTAGIDIVRTSPDHGTANAIAGQNIANPESFREALFLVKEIIQNRMETE